MNPGPDYVILTTDGPHEGHGLAFTISRGYDIVAIAINALRPLGP